MTNAELSMATKLIGLFHDFPTWTKDKRNILDLVEKYFEKGVHEYFTSNCASHVAYVGDYYIEKEDHLRQGTLAKYRGKKVIVMCVGHGSYHVRHYLLATVLN